MGNIPHGTIVGRVMEFFERNPDEVLHWDDIGVKFDLTETQVREVLRYLRKIKRVTVETVRVVKLAAADA